MSRMARKQFSAKTGMPEEFKVMGTISTNIAKKINNMAITGDKSDSKEILEHLVHQHLKTPLGKINVDQYTDPFEGKFNISQNYDTEKPLGGFFLCTKGLLMLEIGKRKIQLQPNKIYFVNDRTAFRVYKETSVHSVLMSAVFVWDKKVHGS